VLALAIRYLQGVAVGSHGSHWRVEWPSHPARVFMAMVAAHHNTGADPAERSALLWLEELPPPHIHVPDALPCRVVTQYVPVNDDSSQFSRDPQTKKVKFYQEITGIPLRRNRQDRPPFARASLATDTMVLHWPDANPTPEICNSFASLCAKVTRIGHSTSLVQMWLTDIIPAGLRRWAVDEGRATQLLRVARSGTLEELERDFNGEAISRYESLLVALEDAQTKKAATAVKKQLAAVFPGGEPPRYRPRISTYAGYAKADEALQNQLAQGTVFSPNLVIFTLQREDGRFRELDLACTLALTDCWRDALVSHANDLSAETRGLLSGHASDGAPSQEAHAAFLPLGFVGHQHADGHLFGVALALPESVSGQLRSEVLRAAARVSNEGLKLGRLGAWKLNPETMVRPLQTLRSATWTAHPEGATHWSTVTPIAYDQHPKEKARAKYLAEVAAMIAAACNRIGLPSPREVIATAVSAHPGAPPAHAFPRLLRKDGSDRRHTHAIIVFDEPVRGPLILGAGRYRGYGLCRPMEAEA
jgi:CRISPR-associated protein Csb2